MRIFVVVSVLFWVSCGDPAFQRDYDAVKKGIGQPGNLAKLVALDQKYPDRLVLKVDLGASYLSLGVWEQAQAYLDRGETLVGSADDKLKSVLWADLAQAALMKGDAAGTVRYADLALQSRDEALGVVFTRAKAYLLLGKAKEALADFQNGWDSKRCTMTAQDYNQYSKALVANGQYAPALKVLEAYRGSWPYELGTGIVESLCYENLGRYDESVLAAFVDLNYQQSRALIASPRILENVRTLAARIKERGLPPEKSGMTTIQAVEAWVLGHWERVDFDDTLLATSPEAKFFRLSSLLMLGRADDADLKVYSDLERRFRDFPSYYLPLLQYQRDVRHDVRNHGFSAMAERVVDLSPWGPWAEVGRKALTLAYGLNPDQAASLMTRAEVDQAMDQADWGRVLNLWSTPDNPSVQYSLERMGTQVRDPAVRTRLGSLLPGVSARAKERWNLVLQSR